MLRQEKKRKNVIISYQGALLISLKQKLRSSECSKKPNHQKKYLAPLALNLDFIIKKFHNLINIKFSKERFIHNRATNHLTN